MTTPEDPANAWHEVTDNLNRTDPAWNPHEVHPRLWIGGTPDHDLVIAPGTLTSPWAPSVHKDAYDSCLTATPVAGPAGTLVNEYRITFRDTRSDAPLPREDILEGATWAVRRWHNGDRVLVRCRGGVNRSALLTGLVLVALRPEITWEEAVIHLREVRHPSLLNNPRLYALGAELTPRMRAR